MIRYRSIFPQSQRDNYSENDNVDWVLSLENESLVPGTVRIEGIVQAYSDAAKTTHITGDKDAAFDHHAGAHSLFRDFTCEFQKLGVVENFVNYPRHVKMQTFSSLADESMGTESGNAVEMVCPTHAAAKGLLEGNSSAIAENKGKQGMSFSIKPRICINKASGPLSSNATGQIRLRTRLAANREVLYGDSVDVNYGYQIKQLRLRFQTIPAPAQLQPVQMSIMNGYRAILDSNNQNISTFVPGLCDSVAMSFILQTDESTYTKNYLQCAPVPGVPPLGASSSVDTKHYGIERLFYAINDTDTALVGFDLESREEIVMNGLRALNANPEKYGALLRHQQDPAFPDCYLAGIPFGGLIDFTQNKFACELQSLCSTATDSRYAAYLYFNTVVDINA